MGGALRILQAGNLCLNEPLHEDCSILPKRLKDLAAQARFQSAQKLFDTAIAERVHLVVLCDLLKGEDEIAPDDSRTYWYLQQEFTRLLLHQIKVVCIDTCQQAVWPDVVKVPENVHFLGKDQSIGFRIGTGAVPVEIDWHDFEIQSRASQENGCCLQLREASGCVNEIRYFTSGNSEPITIGLNSTQTQAGNSGIASLVTLNQRLEIHSRSVDTAAVAWESVPITVGASESFDQISSRIRQELAEKYSSSKLTLVELCEQESSRDLTQMEWQRLLGLLRHDAETSQSNYWPLRVKFQEPHISVYEESPQVHLKEALKALAEIGAEDICDELGIDAFDIDDSAWREVKSLVRGQLFHVMSNENARERLLSTLS